MDRLSTIRIQVVPAGLVAVKGVKIHNGSQYHNRCSQVFLESVVPVLHGKTQASQLRAMVQPFRSVQPFAGVPFKAEMSRDVMALTALKPSKPIKDICIVFTGFKHLGPFALVSLACA